MHFHTYLIRLHATGKTVLMRVLVAPGSLNMPDFLNMETGAWEPQAMVGEFDKITAIDWEEPSDAAPAALIGSGHFSEFLEVPMPSDPWDMLRLLIG